MVLLSPKAHELNYDVRFGFKVLNNVVEFEAILVGLKLANEIQKKRLLITPS